MKRLVKDKPFYELWCQKAVAVVDPRNSNKFRIGVTVSYRYDLYLVSHPELAGQYITNDVYENPTTKKREVTHVQEISLQQLNDIITVSNKTKIKHHTGQKLLPQVTPELAMKAAHSHIPLIAPEDDVFFVSQFN